jgi:Cu/Ag efflux pump CusA
MMSTPMWSSLEYTRITAKEVIWKLEKIPWVKSVATTIGRSDADAHASWVNSAEFEIHIDTDIIEKKKIESDIQSVYDTYKWKVLFSLGQPITHRMQELSSWVRAPIALKLYWKDLDVLQSQAKIIVSTMEKIKWIVNAQVEQELKIPQVEIYTDRDLSLYNWVSVWVLNDELDMSFMWEVATEVLDWNERYPVIVKYDPSWRWDINTLWNTIIPTGYEKPVVLNQIATIQRTRWQNKISHDWAQRRIIISWFIKDRDVVSIVDELKSELDKVNMPSGYFISYEWDYKNQKEASKKFFIMAIFVIIWVSSILFWHFRSMMIVWQIFLDVFTAFLWGMIAVYLSWNVISTAHLVWFISLIWIVSRNWIMLISHYLHLMKVDKMEWWNEMIIKWSLERVVPVMMTALTASLALIPLLISWWATWKEFLNPLATVIFWWIIFSTIVELFIRPWIFYAFWKKAAYKSINHVKEDF